MAANCSNTIFPINLNKSFAISIGFGSPLQGVVRPVLAVAMIGFGIWMLWGHRRAGWVLEPPEEYPAPME